MPMVRSIANRGQRVCAKLRPVPARPGRNTRPRGQLAVLAGRRQPVGTFSVEQSTMSDSACHPILGHLVFAFCRVLGPVDIVAHSALQHGSHRTHFLCTRPSVPFEVRRRSARGRCVVPVVHSSRLFPGLRDLNAFIANAEITLFFSLIHYHSRVAVPHTHTPFHHF